MVMTGASAVGLVAMFTVDMVDMYFLTLLGEQELAAAVGFAGTLLFFLVAVSIGLQIAMGALVARAEGAHLRDLAGRYCTSTLLFAGLVSALLSLGAWLYLEELLHFLGAREQTLDYAVSYARILLPNTPVLAIGMSAAAAARAVGDARRSMWATLAGSLVNAGLDPLFIFTFGWGLEGAAYASVAARIVVLLVAWHAISSVHDLPRRVSAAEFLTNLRHIMGIALPAMLTNLATPIGGSFVLRSMAQFGDAAVAGAAITGRITPVAFAAIFALSSAVGPIIGQNAGAGLYRRVRGTLRDAILFNTVYVLVIWGVLALAGQWLVSVFSASEQAADLILFYTAFLAPAFLFNGMLFVSNASFNNLHRPRWATAFNFSKVLLGTIPCVWLGAQWYGARGVMAGEAVSAVLFGIVALFAVTRLVNHLEREHELVPARADEGETPVPAAGVFSSSLSHSAQANIEVPEDGDH
jgi:putative MATE family efflux protein